MKALLKPTTTGAPAFTCQEHGRALAWVLLALYRKNIVVKDLNPANIKYLDGCWVIIDGGLAKGKDAWKANIQFFLDKLPLTCASKAPCGAKFCTAKAPNTLTSPFGGIHVPLEGRPKHQQFQLYCPKNVSPKQLEEMADLKRRLFKLKEELPSQNAITHAFTVR